MARPDLRAVLHCARETARRAVRDRVAVQINGGVPMVGLAVEPISEGKETFYGLVFIDQKRNCNRPMRNCRPSTVN